MRFRVDGVSNSPIIVDDYRVHPDLKELIVGAWKPRKVAVAVAVAVTVTATGPSCAVLAVLCAVTRELSELRGTDQQRDQPRTVLWRNAKRSLNNQVICGEEKKEKDV